VYEAKRRHGGARLHRLGVRVRSDEAQVRHAGRRGEHGRVRDVHRDDASFTNRAGGERQIHDARTAALDRGTAQRQKLLVMEDAVKTQLEELIKKNKVLLFMKGNKHFPQCGFSAQVVGILKEVGTTFETVNVLQDPAVRDGIKEYSSWPTIPQLYIEGEFIGGCDIVKEMYATGDLQKKLGIEEKPFTPPKITVDAGAAAQVKAADDGSGDVLRLAIGPSFQYDLSFDAKKPGDIVVETSGIAIHMDRGSAKKADGMSISWVETKDGGAFRIENPNEPARVKGISPSEVKKWLDEGKSFAFFDVRTDEELRTAKVEPAKHLEGGTGEALSATDKSMPVVFMCHHGMRSRNAAERALKDGFKNVYNLEGGIDAWSQTVDSKVPRY
jgi:monothiol glutaredoxin